jgi:arginase family enzyme
MFIVKVPGINSPLNKTKGCEKAGNAVLKILKEEMHSNESGKEIDFANLNLEEIHLNNSNLELTNKLIYENAFETFELKPKTVFLGGDHSVSYSLTRAFLDYCENSNPAKEPCLIVFDSSPNLNDSNKREIKHPNNEEWLISLIKKGFPFKNILLVGNRNFKSNELDFIKEHRIRTISLNQILLDIEDSCDIIMEFSNNKELYISIDMSVIDPVFAPSTSSRSESGGLTSREFIYLIQRINKIKRLRAIDLVEINAEEDKKFNNLTLKLGAKILSELL